MNRQESIKSSEMIKEKSRRDGTLLTVDFNLRLMDATHSEVPQGRYFRAIIVSSLRDFGVTLLCAFRRLKPTVNKMLSLRDISPNSDEFYFDIPKWNIELRYTNKNQ